MESGSGGKLVLLRHAKSAWPPGVPDHDRPLGPRGRRDAPRAGCWLRLAGYLPDTVACSTARRARETWQLAQQGLGCSPPVRFEHRIYQASAASLLELIRRLPSGADTAVVVGHDPAIQELAIMLAAAAPRSERAAFSTPSSALDRLQTKFPTAAVAVLDFTGSWSELRPSGARLAAFVTPHDMPRARDAEPR
jgi:phosphohistidine phosphatase